MTAAREALEEIIAVAENGGTLDAVVKLARIGLRSLPGDPYLDDDGDVTLDWRTADDSLLSISVEPGGRAVYAWHLDSGQRGSGTVDLGYGAHIVLAALHAPLSGQPLPDGREPCKQDETETGLETK